MICMNGFPYQHENFYIRERNNVGIGAYPEHGVSQTYVQSLVHFTLLPVLPLRFSVALDRSQLPTHQWQSAVLINSSIPSNTAGGNQAMVFWCFP